MEFNYGACDRPDCDYCTQIKAANPGVTPLAPAASVDALKLTEDTLGLRIDAAVSGLVHGAAAIAIVDDAPAAATDGSVYIVAATPKAGGVFVGHANEVASKAAGAWKFQPARPQETHLVEADNVMWTWSTTTTPASWVKVGSVSGGGKIHEAIHKATDKPVPVDDDEFAITDSADAAPATFTLKKLTWANVKKAIWKSASDAGDNTPLDPNDTFVTLGGNTGALLKTKWQTVLDTLAKLFPLFANPHAAPVIGNVLRYTSAGWDTSDVGVLLEDVSIPFCHCG